MRPPVLSINSIACGGILIVVGVAGYILENAKSALYSGLIFGFLNIFFGVEMFTGLNWSRKASALINSLLLAMLTWRVFLGWSKFLSGEINANWHVPMMVTTMWIAVAWLVSSFIRDKDHISKRPHHS
eukprot:TRINITY_DN1471_c0_g1_i1.p2 TRINITY_DN1471_c0_g1~~TRINITY_DN1471_c0_g1_i1.p2  ORF type:complete len:128 (-),score=31.86 TRINITY_DN1471_c0_g1_i1:655-1038(-)